MSNVLPPPPGLAFPPHHGEPAPPPQHQSRPRDDERPTRKRASLFDRTKILLLLGGLWAFLVAATTGDNELLPLSEAMQRNLRGGPLLLVIAFAAEVLRQVHYLIAENSGAYHQSWKRMFAGTERQLEKLGDYNRFRIGRALKLVAYLVILAILLGAITHTSPITALIEVPARIISMMPLILQFALAGFFMIFQFAAIFWFLSKGGVDVYHPDEVRTRFSDVWGQDHVVERVRENLVFLENPERIEEKGGYVPSGILLWGPPGTGKTLLAEATAGETGKPFVFIDPGAFKAMFIGIDVLKVKSLFRRARRLAIRYGGVVLFFDEADTLGNRGQLAAGGFGQGKSVAWDAAPSCNGFAYLPEHLRHDLAMRSLRTPPEGIFGSPDRIIMGGGMGGGGGALQTLLAELSGLKKPRGFINRYIRKALGMRPKPPPKYRILVMMASNMPEALDEALLRPGRIDRIYKVGYPGLDGRIRTYRGYLEKVRHSLTDREIEKIATMTAYGTGATIKDLVNEALIVAIGDGRDCVTWADMIAAKHIKALGPSEGVDYIARERHATALHEACHAVAAHKTRFPMDIDLATIEKGSTYLGMVAYVKPEDSHSIWRSEYEARIMTSLSSLAGERMFFDGDHASGVSGDLESATGIAALMESAWGMGETIAANSVLAQMSIGGGGKKPDKWGKFGGGDLEVSLGDRIERKLADLYRDTEALLQDNRAAILAVAHALENNKTIAGADVEAIIDGREGPLYDGRSYHLPGFQAQLEAYHAECVRAHKDQADVTAPMPALPPYHGPGSRGATWVLVPDPPQE